MELDTLIHLWGFDKFVFLCFFPPSLPTYPHLIPSAAFGNTPAPRPPVSELTGLGHGALSSGPLLAAAPHREAHLLPTARAPVQPQDTPTVCIHQPQILNPSVDVSLPKSGPRLHSHL